MGERPLIQRDTAKLGTVIAHHRLGVATACPRDAIQYVDHALGCDNEFIAVADPAFGARPAPDGDAMIGGTPWKYALCRSGGAAEYDANYELLFAPDATRGVRVVGMLTWEGGMNPAAVWPGFAKDALKVGACKK